MKDLPHMAKIIEAVKGAVSLPVSVKTRIGFNHDTAGPLEIAKVVEGSGADMIAVHARLAKNFHGGDPDWSALGEMKAALKIPLIGNGGVFEPEDAGKMIAASGVDGVMIGRGAIGNAWIFNQIKSGALAPSLDERRAMIAEHLRRLVALNEAKQKSAPRASRYTPEESACIQFRTHIPYYVKGMFDKKRLLTKLATLKTVDAILEEVDALIATNKRDD